MLKQLIKPPPGSHQIERISQTKNRTGLLVWATHQQTIYKSLLINIRLYQYHINFYDILVNTYISHGLNILLNIRIRFMDKHHYTYCYTCINKHK